MAVLTRQAYVAPTIDNETVKIFNNLEALKYLYRNEQDFPSNTYDDVQRGGFIPSILFWADKDCHYERRRTLGAKYIDFFAEYDPKVPLRGGNFKRTELGYMFPEMLNRDDDIKPGENLVMPKMHFPTIYQDKNADIGPIHYRSCVDRHLLDFADNFNSFADYDNITNRIFNSMNYGLRLADQLLVDTFIVGLFGGYLHSYPVGHPLYRFFDDAAGDLKPDEQFSKDAKAFFSPDGNVHKKVQEVAKWTHKFFKAKKAYLTNIVEGEFIASKSKVEIPKYSDVLIDTSDKEKCLKAVRQWYLTAGSDGKYTQAGYRLRRLSLYSFLANLAGTIHDLTELDARNWSGHDFYGENKDKLGIALRCEYSDLVVFINREDYMEAKNGLTGSEFMGPITSAANTTISDLENLGVNFVPLQWVLPGNSAIIDKAAFTVKEYYHSDNIEYFAYHLVESRIKHVFKQIVMYSKMVGRVIQPGKNQQYAVPLYWGTSHLPFLTEKA